DRAAARGGSAGSAQGIGRAGGRGAFVRRWAGSSSSAGAARKACRHLPQRTVLPSIASSRANAARQEGQQTRTTMGDLLGCGPASSVRGGDGRDFEATKGSAPRQPGSRVFLTAATRRWSCWLSWRGSRARRSVLALLALLGLLELLEAHP